MKVLDTMSDVGLQQWNDVVREQMLDALRRSALSPFLDTLKPIVGSGKLLRAKIAYRLIDVTGVDSQRAIECACAVELFHAATLLHDDVIDGAELRRRAPAFWTQKGMSGAILVGDMLVCKALKMLARGCPERLEECIDLLTDVCDGEIRQELVTRDTVVDCDNCVETSSKKTGSLFALVALSCAGGDDVLALALKQAGLAAGTAYQVADDILDHYGSSELSGKPVRLDAAAGKYTLAQWTEQGRVSPEEYISNLLEQSGAHLAEWPEVCAAWSIYLEEDLKPVIAKCIGSYREQSLDQTALAANQAQR